MKQSPVALLIAIVVMTGSVQADHHKKRNWDKGDRKAAMLAKFDVDGDGRLSEVEKAAMKEAMLAKRMAQFDEDGDGMLNDAEEAAMKAADEERKATRLEKFDTDGDGQLNDEERREAFRKAAKHERRKAKFDLDGDGRISPEERAQMKAERKARKAEKGMRKGKRRR